VLALLWLFASFWRNLWNGNGNIDTTDLKVDTARQHIKRFLVMRVSQYIYSSITCLFLLTLLEIFLHCYCVEVENFISFHFQLPFLKFVVLSFVGLHWLLHRPNIGHSNHCTLLSLLLISAPSPGVYLFFVTVCLSRYLSVMPLQIASSFLFLDGMEPFLGRQYIMSPCTKRCS